MSELLDWHQEIPGSWDGETHLTDFPRVSRQLLRGKSGVYRLFRSEADILKPKPIERLGALDRTGTLYIGRSEHDGSVLARMRQMVRSLRPRNLLHRKHHLQHPTGRLIDSNPMLKALLPFKELAIEWAYDDYPEILEGNMLWRYFECFGETPPLNSDRSSGWFSPFEVDEGGRVLSWRKTR